jgi:putative nucleotidyltransferase with HDIG domain
MCRARWKRGSVATSEAARLARLRAEIVNCKDLPTIPVLLARILAVVDGDRSSARDLVDVMQRDQALAGRVLRLANSGFFGFSRQVSTLARAVMILGFTSVRSLALGVKVWETLIGHGNASLAALGEHSALVGAAARLIAQRTRSADPEEVFTAGLLHDIGRVVLTRKFPAEYAGIVARARDDGQSLIECERAAFGIDHTQAGAWLGETWALPKPIVEAATRHHDEIGAATALGTSLIVNLANRLVHWTDLDGGIVDPEAERRLETLTAVGLSLASWLEIAAVLQGQKSDLEQFFGSAP